MRILVVEDDPAIRHLIDRILTRGGHRLILARHADDARALLLDFPGPLQVALIDLVLPGKPGLEFADELVNEFPTIRLIFMTGATLLPEISLAKARGIVLEKPFRVADLGRVIGI